MDPAAGRAAVAAAGRRTVAAVEDSSLWTPSLQSLPLFGRHRASADHAPGTTLRRDVCSVPCGPDMHCNPYAGSVSSRGRQKEVLLARMQDGCETSIVPASRDLSVSRL